MILKHRVHCKRNKEKIIATLCFRFILDNIFVTLETVYIPRNKHRLSDKKHKNSVKIIYHVYLYITKEQPFSCVILEEKWQKDVTNDHDDGLGVLE